MQTRTRSCLKALICSAAEISRSRVCLEQAIKFESREVTKSFGTLARHERTTKNSRSYYCAGCHCPVFTTTNPFIFSEINHSCSHQPITVIIVIGCRLGQVSSREKRHPNVATSSPSRKWKLLRSPRVNRFWGPPLPVGHPSVARHVNKPLIIEIEVKMATLPCQRGKRGRWEMESARDN